MGPDEHVIHQVRCPDKAYEHLLEGVVRWKEEQGLDDRVFHAAGRKPDRFRDGLRPVSSCFVCGLNDPGSLLAERLKQEGADDEGRDEQEKPV